MPARELTALTPEETTAAGVALGRTLAPGDVVALYGGLGAGKTCFTQGLVAGLGVQTRATSPTFVLVNEYQGRLPVHHADAYRTSSLTELIDLGLLDLLGGDGVTIVEWADRAEALLPARAIRVRIDGLGDEPRRITIEDPRAPAGSVSNNPR
ncbi:MAG TPA: tRNA (adenosine(37)-N6)-threonylcarbamoyltransferase complex ATPase subunit type 1 TsaE [Methylomirabilota bacterium]|nr:tRNA (adenosine(37)-N6)-threonylcarbamoyltransferase complex ATPase subunit type 1 TsaE [Methylomirabilota bacterium]